MSSPPTGLSTGEMHVWRIDLDRSAEEMSRLAARLSPEERARADRFHADRDGRRYAVAHGGLREILSRYVGIPPEDLLFARNVNGKPHLLIGAGLADLRFSLSHSADRALIAVARNRPVGVDVQRIDPEVRVLRVAERFFSAQERDALRALPARRRVEEFFRLWVCKEAYVKARGESIAGRLTSFAVAIDSAGRAGLVEDARDPDAPALWRLELLEGGPGFAAAVACPGPCDSVVLRDWPDIS